jgi:hypothetical protein
VLRYPTGSNSIPTAKYFLTTPAIKPAAEVHWQGEQRMGMQLLQQKSLILVFMLLPML